MNSTNGKKVVTLVAVISLVLCVLGVIMFAMSMKTYKQTSELMQQVAKEREEGNSSENTESKVKEENKDSMEEVTKDENTSEEITSKEDKQEEVNADRQDEQKEDAKEDKAEEKNDKESSTDLGKSEDLAAPSVCGKLAVKSGKLVDENNNIVQLKGISTHGLSWFPTFVNQDAFRQFRQEWNVNVMRLAMYTAEYHGYCTDGNQEDLKNIIYRGVQYATDHDMYVIIDWHILSDNNPNTYKEEAKDFFAGMSAKYKDNNNVIYEICNEPNGGTSWSDIKSYAEEVIGVIRENDKDAVILVGTPNWSQRVDEAAKDPITDYDNIMYTLHFYAATHKDDLRSTLKSAVDAGLPVFVSEYGICDASGNGGLDYDSAKEWMDLLDANDISSVCWALANKDESAALIKSSCDKTCQFQAEDLSDSGKWLYEMLTGSKAAKGNSDQKKSDGNQDKDEKKSDAKAESFKSSGLDGAVSLNSKWDDKAGINYQYDMTLTNPGDSSVSSWAIDIHFSDDITLVEGWGGKYTVNGNTLHVISLDYNGKIKAGDTLKDLGFIITGPSGLKVID